MKNAPLQTLLLRTQKPSQLFAGIFGAMLGLSLILIAVQMYFNFNNILNAPDQGVGSQYLVVNKEISVLNSLNLGNSNFETAEIQELNKLPFVSAVGAFESNQYPAKASLNLAQFGVNNGFVTDIFMESVESQFLDLKPNQFQWTMPTSDQTTLPEVPIILPTDFINLYNFNYAPSRGLPQISKDVIKLAPFQLLLGDPLKKSMLINARIAGFSNRIGSVLVPINFLRYSNQQLSQNSSPAKPNKLIIAAQPNKLPELQNYLDEMGYETNQELMRNGKFHTLLQVILGSVAALGLIVIFVAVSSFVLYLQLSITQSKYELETLLRLGLSHHQLTRWYVKGIALILLGISLISTILLYTTNNYIYKHLIRLDFQPEKHIHAPVIYAGTALIIIVFLVQYRTIRNQIFQLSLPSKPK
jgi:hypothetical protein